VLIPRNTTIPVSKSETFSTAADAQTAVDVQVSQGERALAKDNRSLANFRLDGLAPAPRGVPQVEVTFDIDANGIVNVKAKDKATGREQKVTIQSGGGLSKDEVERLVKEAAINETADKGRRETIEARNNLDNLVYQVDKLLRENKEKLPASEVTAVEAALGEARSALDSDDATRLKAAFDSLQKVSMKLGEAAYAQAGPPADDGSNGSPNGAGGPPPGTKRDDVIDADFEEA